MGLVSFFISIFRRPEERPSPERVFTPRAAEVNPDMYVSRPLLEQKITEALGGTRHFIVHGESGNGKSWLYKKVFKDLGVNYVVVNLANASRLGSLNAALEDKINRSEKGKLIESSSRDTWSVKPGGFGADNAVTNKYQLGNKEPFEWLLQHIRERAGNGPACVVMDNFEQILSDQAIVKQISDCIILLDDEDYSKYGVKLCLVGVPSNIKEYVAGRGHYDTISNRVVELPEVARLTREQAMQLLHRGLEQELKLKVEDPEACYDRIMWRTDRIAQHLHEYGLEVAQIASSAGIVTLDVVDRAGNNWLTSSVESARSVIENRLNARETKAGRRNQTIYALGISKSEEFRYSDVEEIVRQEFPTTTSNVQLNIAGILSELSAGDNPPIKRVPKGDAYRFVNPKYRMAIRTMLRKTDNETVEKIVLPK